MAPGETGTPGTPGAPDGRRRLFAINSVDDGMGGTLRVIVNLADQLAAEGDHAAITAPWIPESRRTSLNSVDSRVDRLLFRASAPAARFGGSLRQYRWLRKHITEFDEVHIQSMWNLSSLYMTALGHKHGVPVLLWPQSSLDPYDVQEHAALKKLLGPTITRWTLNHAAAVVCATRRERQEMITYGAEPPMFLMPLPVQPLDVSAADPRAWRDQHGVPADVPVVLFMSRVNHKKRLPLLIEAFAGMERTDAVLVVVGAGEDSELAACHQAIARHGLADRVFFTGWLEGAERATAAAVGDVFALISDNENFGLAPVEVASVGCPVVVSDQVYVADDLLASGAAIVVERDATLVANALDRVLNDDALRAELSERGRAVAQEYAPASVTRKLRELSAQLTPGQEPNVRP